MYSICAVIYGVPMTDKVMERINDVDSHGMCDDPEAFGFTALYHGAAPYIPGYCGVQYHEFDESTHMYQLWDEFVADENKLTLAMKEEAQKMFDALEPEIKAALAEDGITKCDSYIVWFTS